jgi:hypothetical protein
VDPHEAYFRTLSPEEEQLLILRDFLYEGDWEEMLRDLKDRRIGRPFIFKLNTRIEEDIQRIQKLRSYEQAHEIDLGRYVRSAERAGDPEGARDLPAPQPDGGGANGS